MSCFVVPATEAIVTTIVTKVVKSKEKKAMAQAGCSHTDNAHGVQTCSHKDVKAPFSQKLKWLNNMLWGGSALLAFEHIWHGEVISQFPFLTGAQSAESAGIMLREMSTVGVAMSVLVTAVWACMVMASNIISIKSVEPSAEELGEG